MTHKNDFDDAFPQDRQIGGSHYKNFLIQPYRRTVWLLQSLGEQHFLHLNNLFCLIETYHLLLAAFP